MFELFLFLHVLGAIVAYGFGFAVPVVGRMASRDPISAAFFLRSTQRVSDTILLPAAISMGVTGAGLIYFGSRTPREMWLSIAMGLYVVAILVVLFVQRPLLKRLIAITATPPGPDGPDPDVARLAARARMVGYGLTAAVIVIVLLMVYKPTF